MRSHRNRRRGSAPAAEQVPPHSSPSPASRYHPTGGKRIKQRPRHRTASLELLEHRRILTVTFSQFTASQAPLTPESPQSIVAGPGGNLWYTLSELNISNVAYNGYLGGLAKVDPTTHLTSVFPLPPGDSATDIVAGPDGNVWFTDPAGKIGEINPTTYAINEFPLPLVGGVPTAITSGPDGNLWFVVPASDDVGEINPSTHVVRELPLAALGLSPTDITAGADGNLWFTEQSGNQIGEINPTTFVIQEFKIPTADSKPTDIVAAPGGNLWFTEQAGNNIGEINPNTDAISIAD